MDKADKATFTDPRLAPIAYGLACAVAALPGAGAALLTKDEAAAEEIHLTAALECLKRFQRGDIKRDFLALATAHLLLALEHRPRE
jgi:hypothetical protein